MNIFSRLFGLSSKDSCYYNIQWKECPCMKDVRLEDVTPELSNKAYEEIKHVDY